MTLLNNETTLHMRYRLRFSGPNHISAFALRGSTCQQPKSNRQPRASDTMTMWTVLLKECALFSPTELKGLQHGWTTVWFENSDCVVAGPKSESDSWGSCFPTVRFSEASRSGGSWWRCPPCHGIEGEHGGSSSITSAGSLPHGKNRWYHVTDTRYNGI